MSQLSKASSLDVQDTETLEFGQSTTSLRKSPTSSQPSSSSSNHHTISSNEIQCEPATKKERLAWISYDWANSVFASVALVFALPLLLDYWAFHAGSGFPLPTLSSGEQVSKLPDFGQIYSQNQSWYQSGSCVEGNSTLTVTDQLYYDRCVVPWGTGYIRHSTWTLNIISLSVAVQAFIFISLGSLADHGRFRKLFMMAFAYSGALFTSLLAIPTPSTYWLGGVLAVLANVCFGVSVVFYNAYLPLITAADPEIIDLKLRQKNNPSPDFIHKLQQLSENISNKLSTHGFAAGYFSGMLLAMVGSGLYIAFGVNVGFKIAMVLTGVWWALFTIPSLMFLKTRPGGSLPSNENYFFYSWKSLFKTLKSIKKLPTLFTYLLCYFLFSDGYNTIAQVAVLFAENELKVDKVTIGVLVVLTPFAAFAGNYFFFFIQKKTGATSKKMVITCLFCYCVLSLYGICGLIPSSPIGFKSWNVILLNDKCQATKNADGYLTYDGPECKKVPWELYLFSVVHGMLLGAVQSFSRVVYSELIPPGREAEFFSLYEISDRGSSWLGPLVVGALNNSGGTLRLSFIYFAASFLIPIPLLWRLNMEKGRVQAIDISDGNQHEKCYNHQTARSNTSIHKNNENTVDGNELKSNNDEIELRAFG